MAFTILYTTHPDKGTAKRIVKALLDAKLIACANLFESESMYRWQGKRVEEQEVIALLKTTDANADAAEKKILALHPYDTPCVIRLPVQANKGYEEWLSSCMRKA